MKNNILNPTQTWSLAAGVACLACLTLRAAPEPYSVDADTLHLWHFNEVQNTNTTLPAFVVQDVSALSFYDLDVTNGAKLEAPAFSVPLIGALDNRGIPGALQYGAGALSEDNLFYYPDDFAGASGEFTLEALVKPDFDPATPDVPRPPMQIMSLENEGGTEARVFQFRLNSTTTNSQYALEFLNIGSAAAGSNTPVTVKLIDDYEGTLSNFTDKVILDNGGTTTNTYAWETSGGTLQITTTVYDAIEQYALVTNLTLPVGQQLVCDYIALNLGSQDIGLFVGDGIPPGTPTARSNYVTVYVRADGNIYTRGFDGATEYGLVGGGIPSAIDYLFIDRIASNVFQTGFYNAGVRTILATRTNTVGGVGSSVGVYADVRAVGTRGSIDNLRFATNYLAVPPADPELFTALLPTNGVNAAHQGEWYHVAVSYNGAQNTANNLMFYWTSLSNSPASASPLASFQMTNDLGSASGGATIEADFAIGNEGRDAPGESFNGFIDEVRVSDVVRAAGAFNLNGTPYTADANTRLLYHLDESNPADFPTTLLNDALDEASGSPVALHVRDGASFGAMAWSNNFGTAVLVSPGTGTNNAPAIPAAGAFADDGLPFSSFSDPVTGAFTYEALVRPDFDPNTTDGNSNMEIISMDDEGGRPFQFKFRSRGSNDVPLVLEFINIEGTAGEEHLTAPVPTAGPHQIVASTWYHAAVTFNGNTNDPNNLKVYWTALGSGATSANPLVVTNESLGGTGMAGLITTPDGDFCVGNEARSASSEALLGALDEVRISRVARAADQFLLSEPRPEITSITVNQGAGQVTLVWTSQAGKNYTISRSTNLAAAGGGFGSVATGIPGTAPTTTNTVSVSGSNVELYRVEVE